MRARTTRQWRSGRLPPGGLGAGRRRIRENPGADPGPPAAASGAAAVNARWYLPRRRLGRAGDGAMKTSAAQERALEASLQSPDSLAGDSCRDDLRQLDN